MSEVLHVVADGAADALPVFLLPSLGTSGAMWADVAAALADTYRVLCVDLPGHGESPLPATGSTVADYAAAVLATADDRGHDRFAVAGLSFGGLVAQAIAVQAPSRVVALGLCATSPRFGDPATWRERAALVRAKGTAPLIPATRDRWFTSTTQVTAPDQVDDLLRQVRDCSPEGYARACEALAEADLTDDLARIEAPTLVIGGAVDPVSPPESLRLMATRIADADLLVLPDAAHMILVADLASVVAGLRTLLGRADHDP